MKKIIILLIILLIFLGYTPYNELNNLAVVDTLGIDFTNNKYYLYLNVINDDNKVYTITGSSLGEVFYKARNIDNKKTYYKHLEVVIFNTNIINNETLNFFKDEFTSIDYLVLATNKNMESLFNKYHTKNDYKKYSSLTFKNFISNFKDEIKDAYIPLISYNNKIRNIGFYIPKGNLTINYNLATASNLLNEITNSYNTTIKEGNNSYEIFIYNLKVNTEYKDNTIKINITGNIDSPDTNNLTLLKKKAIKKLKRTIEELINSEKTNSYNISNTINYIYLKTKEINYNTYKKSNLSINIKLKEKEKNNYD